MLWKWTGIALAILIAAPAAAAATDGSRAITLDEALQMAHRNAPAVIQAEGQLRTSRASLRSSYAAFLPSLSLSAGSTRQYAGSRTRIDNNGTVITLPSTPWSYSAGFSAGVSLFEGGARLFAMRQARAGVASAQANEVLQRYQTDLAVKQQYFNVLAARESQVAAQALVDQAQEQLKAAILRLRASTATKSDSLRSVITLSNARLALLQAGTDLDAANAGLTRAIGAQEPVTAAAADSTPPEPVTVGEDELSRLADNGPVVREAVAQRNAARASRNIAWTDYLPSLTASYGRSGSGSGTDPLFNDSNLQYNGTLRLSLSLPVFNQLNREQQVVQSAVALDNADAALRDARLAARQNLITYWGAFQTAEQRIDAQTTSVAAAEEDLRVQQQRYALGESTLLDVLTSQTQLNDARLALIRARYDQRIARAQLEALTGRNL